MSYSKVGKIFDLKKYVFPFTSLQRY